MPKAAELKDYAEDTKKVCPVCFSYFPKKRRIFPGEDPDCCSSKCSYIRSGSQMKKSHAHKG